MKTVSIVTLFLLIAAISYAQREPEFRITVNTNIRVTNNVESAGKEYKVGGFGVGLSWFKPLRERLDLRTSINLLRQVYWNPPIYLKRVQIPRMRLVNPTPKLLSTTHR